MSIASNVGFAKLAQAPAQEPCKRDCVRLAVVSLDVDAGRGERWRHGFDLRLAAGFDRHGAALAMMLPIEARSTSSAMCACAVFSASKSSGAAALK